MTALLMTKSYKFHWTEYAHPNNAPPSSGMFLDWKNPFLRLWLFDDTHQIDWPTMEHPYNTLGDRRSTACHGHRGQTIRWPSVATWLWWWPIWKEGYHWPKSG